MKKEIALLALASFLFLAGCSEPETAGSPIIDTYRSLSPQAQQLYLQQSDYFQEEVHPRLIELDEKRIGCFGPQAVMAMYADGENLGGQCCGVLTDHDAYALQLAALERFIGENEGPDFIPRDPYDTPVEQAQLLTSWDGIRLSAHQQAVYDGAMDMSHHGGPCCCKCWKWHVMSGLAKKLIVDHGWDAHQVAELWDTSSSCGHAEDTNMHAHYLPKEHDAHAHDTHGH